jgi:hypothetical protein
MEAGKCSKGMLDFGERRLHHAPMKRQEHRRPAKIGFLNRRTPWKFSRWSWPSCSAAILSHSHKAAGVLEDPAGAVPAVLAVPGRPLWQANKIIRKWTGSQAFARTLVERPVRLTAGTTNPVHPKRLLANEQEVLEWLAFEGWTARRVWRSLRPRNSWATSSDTSADQLSAVFKPITRIGSVYWPLSRSWMTVSRSPVWFVPPVGTNSDRENCAVFIHRAKTMSDFWRQVKEEISNAKNRTLLLAVIASFIAWLITHLLRIVFD